MTTMVPVESLPSKLFQLIFFWRIRRLGN